MQHPNPHDHAAARRTAGHLRQLEQNRFWRETSTRWTGERQPHNTQRQIRSAPSWWATIARRIPRGTAPNPGCR